MPLASLHSRVGGKVAGPPKLADVELLDLADAVLDKNHFGKRIPKPCVSPGRRLPLVAHIGDQFHAFRIESEPGTSRCAPYSAINTALLGSGGRRVRLR
jgi:hypothetical protein